MSLCELEHSPVPCGNWGLSGSHFRAPSRAGCDNEHVVPSIGHRPWATEPRHSDWIAPGTRDGEALDVPREGPGTCHLLWAPCARGQVTGPPTAGTGSRGRGRGHPHEGQGLCLSKTVRLETALASLSGSG